MATVHRLRVHPVEGASKGISSVYVVAASTPKSPPAYVFKPASGEADDQIRDQYGLRGGIRFGDAVWKEHAAYVLDHDHHAGVPRVNLVTARLGDDCLDRLEFGALCDYAPHDATADDFGASRFSVAQVHAIGLLDCRLFNLDRHEGNILVQSLPGRLRLVPIDHSYTLPSYTALSTAYFCWSSWRQSSLAFDASTKRHVARIQPFKDAVALAKLRVRPESIVTYVICTLTTMAAVAAGMTLAELGAWMQRNEACPWAPSVLETLVQQTLGETANPESLFSNACRLLADAPSSAFIVSFRLRLWAAIEQHQAAKTGSPET